MNIYFFSKLLYIMNLLFEKSFSSLETSNGVKKKSFKIIKTEDNSFKKIAGLSNDGKSYIIKENIKKILPNNGIINKHRTFKINSSEVSSLLNDHFLMQKNRPNDNLLKSFNKENTLHNSNKTLSVLKNTLSTSKSLSKSSSKSPSKNPSKSPSKNPSKKSSKNPSKKSTKNTSKNASKNASKKSSKKSSIDPPKNASNNLSKNASIKKNTHKSIK
jgi:hypothetical protein